MPQNTCEQLRNKLVRIKKLKADLDELLPKAKNLDDISQLQKIQADFESEIENIPLLKFITKLHREYEERIKTLAILAICSKNKPFIIDINATKQPIPSFEQIIAGLTPEVIKKIMLLKEPVLLLTPIGMSIDHLIEKIAFFGNICAGIWQDHLDENKISSLIDDKISYFPENINPHLHHRGKTKKEIIELHGGWLVSVIDIHPIAPAQTRKNYFETEMESQKLFEKKKEQGMRGMTAEEYFLLKTEQLIKGEKNTANNQCFMALDGTILAESNRASIIIGYTNEDKIYVSYILRRDQDEEKITNHAVVDIPYAKN